MPLFSDKHIVDEQFARRLQQHHVMPSGKVWRGVSQKIHASEERNSTTLKAGFVLLLVMVCGGGIWMIANAPERKIQPPATSIASKEFAIATDESTVMAGSSKPEQSDGIFPLHKEKKLLLADNSSVAQPGGNKETVPSYNERFTLTDESVPAVVSDATTSLLIATGVVMKQMPTGSLLSHSQKRAVEKEGAGVNARYLQVVHSPGYYKADVKGAYVGFGQILNSTWVVDNAAITSKTLKYEPTFGTALMIQGGYNLSNSWGVEAGWIIHSGEGQKYKYLPAYSRTTSLVYYEKQLAFDYMQFPVMVRYKVQNWSGLVQVPFFVNYSLGVQYGRLLSYSVDETKEKISESHLFRKNEYAAVAAVDYDFITRGAAFFTLGLRASVGSGLFIKDAPEDLEFDNPHNVLIGIHAGLNFSLTHRYGDSVVK
jgi:hypothetical protein